MSQATGPASHGHARRGRRPHRCPRRAIHSPLVAEPLKQLGLRYDDEDKYAVGLHDSHVTEPAGSGNVPFINHRAIAAMEVMDGQLEAAHIPDVIPSRFD